MTVYVDNFRAGYGRMIMCHMIADNEVELHAMADTLGVARRHHQGDHYDICLAKRALAISAGAVEITAKECAALRRRGNVTGAIGRPDTAIEWLLQWRRTNKKIGNGE